MGKTNFDQLMKRYLTGQVSEQERIKIEAWLEVMKTEETADLELSQEDQEKLFQKIVANKDNVTEITTLHRHKKNPKGWLLRIAATLLVLSLLSYTAWYFTQKDDNVFNISSNDGIEKIILNDGTLVWLHNESTLAYHYKEAEGIRFTEMEGEALFEVAKDPSHPFVIQCGEISLTVMGTSFSVKSHHDSLELNVLTGKVNISLPSSSTSIDVQPHERVVYTGNGKLERTTLKKDEVARIVANTEYDMQFTNVSFKNVLINLEKKFDVKIKLKDDTTGQCRITVDLTDRSMEDSLQLISEILNINYTREGKMITIDGSGCN